MAVMCQSQGDAPVNTGSWQVLIEDTSTKSPRFRRDPANQPMCLRASRRVSFEREASCDRTKHLTPVGSTRA